MSIPSPLHGLVELPRSCVNVVDFVIVAPHATVVAAAVIAGRANELAKRRQSDIRNRTTIFLVKRLRQLG
jgi:hypothetical protein